MTIRFTVVDATTGGTPDLEAIALDEEWASGLIYCDMEGFAVTEWGDLLLLDECGGHRFCPPGRFLVIPIAAFESETPHNCELCGKTGELRRYGPKGEYICYDCGMKDPKTTESMMAKVMFGDAPKGGE